MRLRRIRARLRARLIRALNVQPWEVPDRAGRRRTGIELTGHCVERARQRYRNPDPLQILADVATALRDGRVGPDGPHGLTVRGEAIDVAWTADHARAYVVRRAGGSWHVVTALPTPPSTANQRRRIRANVAAAPPTPIRRPGVHELHPFGTPAVGAALERAGIRPAEETA